MTHHTNISDQQQQENNNNNNNAETEEEVFEDPHQQVPKLGHSKIKDSIKYNKEKIESKTHHKKKNSSHSSASAKRFSQICENEDGDEQT